MGKLILAVISTTGGVFFWYNPVFFPVGKEIVSLAAALWLIALNLILSFTFESSTRVPGNRASLHLDELGLATRGKSRPLSRRKRNNPGRSCKYEY